MVSIILVVLFICQLLSFFFILLLNSKLAKFKDLEMRQERMSKELDDAIGLYLIEMKEENDRLIKELSTVKQTAGKEQRIIPGETAEQSAEEETISSGAAAEAEMAQQRPYVPIAFAANAYNRQKHPPAEQQPIKETPEKIVRVEEIEEQDRVISFEKEVIEMYQAGKTIEEIAKITQKGKTEIELLLKFHA